MGTTSVPASGPGLLLELRRGAGRPLRAQLEDDLRDAVRTSRLPGGARLPSTRVLAGDLGVSRRLVVDAYAQLLAEGYLVASPGSGTYVARTAAATPAPAAQPQRQPPQFDFFPGSPSLADFPRAVWQRALRDVLRSAPDRALGYPDQRGAPALRDALASYLRRVRGVVAEPERIVVCNGATQGLAVLAQVLVARGRARIAVEEPSLPPHRALLARLGLDVISVPVDGEGIAVEQLASRGVDAAVVTPSHQFPTGVALSPARRAQLLEWARAGLVIEDDYDAEFRYDRAPIGALQGLAPESVVYVGSTSKTLAPGLRIAWLVLPAELVDEFVMTKALGDGGSPVLDQLVMARLITTAAYDRHLRQARRRNRARRDALVAALAEDLPEATITGLAAGLHATVHLNEALDERALSAVARRHSVAVYPLRWLLADPTAFGPETALVLGYANLSEAAIAEGVRRLAQAVAAVR